MHVLRTDIDEDQRKKNDVPKKSCRPCKIASPLYLLVLMSIILRADGILGKMAGTGYGEQVTEPRGDSHCRRKKAGSCRLFHLRTKPQPKFFSTKLQFTSLSRKVSTYFGRWLR